jgi:hypothetical protein
MKDELFLCRDLLFWHTSVKDLWCREKDRCNPVIIKSPKLLRRLFLLEIISRSMRLRAQLFSGGQSEWLINCSCI